MSLFLHFSSDIFVPIRSWWWLLCDKVLAFDRLLRFRERALCVLNLGVSRCFPITGSQYPTFPLRVSSVLITKSDLIEDYVSCIIRLFILCCSIYITFLFEYNLPKKKSDELTRYDIDVTTLYYKIFVNLYKLVKSSFHIDAYSSWGIRYIWEN